MTDMSQEIDECPPLSSDDREILADLLYPIFQEAEDQNKHLTRDVLKDRLIKYFFPWIHVRELLDELVEKDYVSLLTTRGGGVYGPGRNFCLWQEEMKVDEDDQSGAGAAAETASPVTLDPSQVRVLADLLKALASSAPPQKEIDKVRLAAVESRNQADFVSRLSRP